jgi:hypothetical protein
MSVFAVDDLPSAFEGAARPGFWQRLARALDASFANRSKRAMPVDAFRRSRRDIERCRRLMRSGLRVPAGAGPMPCPRRPRRLAGEPV